MNRNLADKKILLVEDEAIIAMTEAKMLEKHGFDVDIAHDGQKAVDIARGDDIDLILMDIDLGPGKMDGTEAAEIILRERELPIVFLTGHTERETVEKVKDITRYGYVVKNSGEFVLIESIHMAFELFDAHCRLREREQRYRALFAMNHFPILLIRPSTGEIVEANPAAHDFYGWDEEELLRKRIWDINRLPEDEIFREMRKSVYEEQNVFTFQHVLADGTVRDVEVSSSPISVEGENLLYSIVKDVTERKAMAANLRATLDSIGDAVVSTDQMGRVIQMNPVAEKLTGWRENDAAGKPLGEILVLLHSETREPLENPVDKVLTSGEIVGIDDHTLLLSRDGREYHIADSAAPVRDAEGNIAGIVLVFRDETERYKTAMQLKERMKELDCLYSLSEIVEKPGITLEGILEETARTIPSSWLRPEKCVSRIIFGDEEYRSDRFAITEYKQCSDVTVHGEVAGAVEVYYLNESPERTETPFLEEERKLIDAVAERLGRIIERKQAEEQVHLSMLRSRWLNEISRHALAGWSVDEIIEFTVNRLSEYFPDLRIAYSTVDLEGTLEVLSARQPSGMPDISGLKAGLRGAPGYLEALRGEEPLVIPDVSEDPRMAPLSDAMKEGGTRALIDVPLIHSERLIGILCFDSPFPRRWTGHEVEMLREISNTIGLILENKSYLRQLNESREKYRKIVDDAPIGIVRTRPDGGILEVNPFFAEWLGYTPDELKELKIQDLTHPEDYEKEIDLIAELQRGERSTVEIDKRYRKKDGGWIWGHLVTNILYGEGGNKMCGLGMVVDISQWKEAEEEKDFLMRELNHRVKNNLALVNSLISLKDTELGEDIDLTDLMYRVDTIRIVHEKLLENRRITHIDFKDYIDEILGSIFSLQKGQITVQNSITDITLDVRRAIPLGLIINEAATNAVKHGFDPNGGGTFFVDLREDTHTDEYVLTVSNTGNPFPPDIDIHDPKTLGLQLISALVRQLEGSLFVKRKPHPEISVRFPL